MPLRRVTRATLLLGALLLLCGAGRARDAKVQLEFGVEMARSGSWNEAEFRFLRAAELAPGDPVILNNLAVAYENNGRYEQAKETYLKALEIDPDNDRIRQNYERFHLFYQDLLDRRAREEAGGSGPGRGGAP